MSDYHFKLMLGSHLSAEELNEAADLLSRAYTRWQTHPGNIDPVETDTSPEVYARMMRKSTHEVMLYYEGEQLCGVFVHAVSPQYDQYPLRKLSYLGVFPTERGYEPLKTAFSRYAAFVSEQGEDVVIASDLTQDTLNSLLEQAGFGEMVDRNETYFLLSHLLRRQVLAFQEVKGDFVIDQIITLAGKAVRRNKKLYKLQTTPYDSYDIYYQQQVKRVQRSIPPQNLALVRDALRHPEQGIYFISGFDGTITLEDEAQGGFSSPRAMMGRHIERVLPEIVDGKKSLVYLLPGSEDELRQMAEKIVLRPGFFDFLCFCLKILGSFFVASGATPYQVRFALERPLAPTIPLRYIDLVEGILTPDVELLPDELKPVSDGTLRTAYRYSGPYVDLSGGRYHVKKDLMIETILGYKGDTVTPVVYLGSGLRDTSAVARLFAESAHRRLPVVVFDFGTRLTRWANEELVDKSPEPNPYFGIVSVLDFYQIPVMLEGMGLEIKAGIDLTVATPITTPSTP
jgi:2-hydroxy-3-keto-5-methylthiopentenyl-1-phosphate phosphatase